MLVFLNRMLASLKYNRLAKHNCVEYSCITTAYNMGCDVVDAKAVAPEPVVAPVSSATTATTGTRKPSSGTQFRFLPDSCIERVCRCGKTAFAVNCDRQKCKHDCVSLGGCSLSGHGGTRSVTRPRLSLPGSSSSRPGASNWRRLSAPPLTGASAGEEETCVVVVTRCSKYLCTIKHQNISFGFKMLC